ncbi:hypothetical protein [Nocardia carnea]|uniref:Uncharacterized protein n=1 Tax=Nocardia carnea TaxID=37328 RepID=A0ABW7THC5_9NOCA|nr:hypothetical protein [Nocardia carnea]
MVSTGRANRTWFGIANGSAAPAHADTPHSGAFADRPIAKLPKASSPANQDTRYTEVDGWSAAWRCDRENIRILQVRLASGAPVELSTVGAYVPDLAEMRERFPEHTRLWDAIRHEFWANAIPEGRTG